MSYLGLAIGATTFLTIGAFHPLVIKAEYHMGVGCWWMFLVLGLVCIGGSLFTDGVWSILLGVVGFSSLWSILELVKQRQRVNKGWVPAGPGHKEAKKPTPGAHKGGKSTSTETSEQTKHHLYTPDNQH